MGPGQVVPQMKLFIISTRIIIVCMIHVSFHHCCTESSSVWSLTGSETGEVTGNTGLLLNTITSFVTITLLYYFGRVGSR